MRKSSVLLASAVGAASIFLVSPAAAFAAEPSDTNMTAETEDCTGKTANNALSAQNALEATIEAQNAAVLNAQNSGAVLPAADLPIVYTDGTTSTLKDQTHSIIWSGRVLSKLGGTNVGPSGRESYYDMDMTSIVNKMHRLGYTGEYWVRNDGVKMMGQFIITAGDYDLHPLGSVVESSLGTCIVCDTGGFANGKVSELLDIATAW